MEEDREDQDTNNALLFRLGILNNFKLIAESVSEEEFPEILTILRKNTAKKLHKAMVDELYKSMTADFENILKEGSLQTGLAKICKLSESVDVFADTDLWRPPGNVALHVRSLDAKKIKEEAEELEKRVNELESENAILMNEISERRSKLCAMQDKIEHSLKRSPFALERLEKRLNELEKCLAVLEQE